MNKLTLTLRLVSCDIADQHLSKSMTGAALRALADEIDPTADRSPF